MPLSDKERRHYRLLQRNSCHAVWKGDLLEITYLPHTVKSNHHRTRGTIKGFTQSARLRMLKTVATVEWARVKRAVFITLTYPDSHADRSMQQRTRDRYLFLRSMEKHLGNKVGVLWRVEWQPRKSGARKGQLTAHMHLIAFGVSFIDKEVVRQCWRDVLDADGPVVTWIEGMKDGRKVARYVSKYCAKKVENDVLDNASYLNSLGRHWGMCRRELIPWAERFHVPYLDAKDIHLAENLACMTFRYFTRGTQQGFSVFGEKARKVGEILFERMIDKESHLA